MEWMSLGENPSPRPPSQLREGGDGTFYGVFPKGIGKTPYAEQIIDY